MGDNVLCSSEHVTGDLLKGEYNKSRKNQNERPWRHPSRPVVKGPFIALVVFKERIIKNTN